VTSSVSPDMTGENTN